MSAAHCFLENNNASRISAVVGDNDLDNATDTSYARIINIRRIIPHENYNLDTNENDIALLEVDGEIEFSRGVGPACLPFKYTYVLYDFFFFGFL